MVTRIELSFRAPGCGVRNLLLFEGLYGGHQLVFITGNDGTIGQFQRWRVRPLDGNDVGLRPESLADDGHPFSILKWDRRPNDQKPIRIGGERIQAAFERRSGHHYMALIFERADALVQALAVVRDGYNEHVFPGDVVL